MDDDRLASHVDAIYGLPLDEFIDERDRRVKELRAEGLREEAAALAKARKPTLPAWAVDQLAHRDPDAVGRLLEAGDALREAQRRAASGRGADRLRTATRELRDVVSDLRRRADGILSEAGSSSAAHLQDVERTLSAAAVTPGHHDEVRRGVLDRPLEGAGFGGVGGLTLVPPPADEEPAEEGPADGDAGTEDRTDTGHAATDRQQEEERRREQARARLRREERDLERSHEAQVKRADRAAVKADRLRARADEAASAAAEERAEAERIAAALADVREELRGLEREG